MAGGVERPVCGYFFSSLMSNSCSERPAGISGIRKNGILRPARLYVLISKAVLHHQFGQFVLKEDWDPRKVDADVVPLVGLLDKKFGKTGAAFGPVAEERIRFSVKAYPKENSV